MVDLAKQWDDLLRPVPFMSLSMAKMRVEEIGRIPDPAQRTTDMRTLVMQFKGETDKAPLRDLVTDALIQSLERTYSLSYAADYRCDMGVDTSKNKEVYGTYVTNAVAALQSHCKAVLDDKESDPPSDEEKIVLQTMAAKAHVWMMCHPYLLLSDYQRMPLLTPIVLKVIIEGLSRMTTALSEVSTFISVCRLFSPSGTWTPEGVKGGFRPLSKSPCFRLLGL